MSGLTGKQPSPAKLLEQIAIGRDKYKANRWRPRGRILSRSSFSLGAASHSTRVSSSTQTPQALAEAASKSRRRINLTDLRCTLLEKSKERARAAALNADNNDACPRR